MDTLKIVSSAKADGKIIDSECLYGEYITLCSLIGFEAVEKLYTVYCGGYISLPKKLLADDFVHGYIVECYYNGKKPKELAKEFDYTYGWIMRLIREDRRGRGR